ncbi:signal transduction histidine kinase [Kibdelosporangium banguiense]|uniref:histidine kinase n=1 Tax=Kibdelosporangium banguiense TaxID=1365924 RepID=A0ABS4TF04_9PSEU|nr:histidine kinase [Kibdelosporangium banguiense]MBP2323013.1 signal transduction histidine kinase [Kibdelosporangium banguiense]
MGQVIVRYRDRPWWDVFVALTTFAVALVLYGTGFYAVSTSGQMPIWMLILQSAVLCVAQMFRKKAPLIVLGVATAILLADFAYGLTIPVIIVFVDLLFSATMNSPRTASRFILGSVIVIVLGVGVVTAALSLEWRNAFFNMINAFTLLVVPVWWAINVRQVTEIADAERANSRQLRKIAELDRRTAVAAERAQMARDLHDVVAGHLSAIAIQSEALLTMADRDPQLVKTVLKSVRENSIQSLAEMRAMIEVLRADGGPEDPRTAPARLAELDRLVDSARAGGLDLDVRRSEDTAELPVAVDMAAYRIVQEALTNALKHASGGVAKVEVRVDNEKLVVEVTNELTGAPGTGTGTGLVSMRERAHAVGGEFFAGPWHGGWRVRANLPIGGIAS